MSARSVYSKRNRYYLPKYRRMELYYFCLQYNGWKAELEIMDGRRAVSYDTESGGSGDSDPTFDLALKRLELEEKILLIEECAYETDSDLARYIIYAVTNKENKYEYMYTVLNIPCSRGTYYARKWKFYFLLDKKMKFSIRAQKNVV